MDKNTKFNYQMKRVTEYTNTLKAEKIQKYVDDPMHEFGLTYNKGYFASQAHLKKETRYLM